MTVEERGSDALSRLAGVECLLALEGLKAADDLPSGTGVSTGLHQIVFAVIETPEPIRHLPAPMMNSEVGDEDEECGGGV